VKLRINDRPRNDQVHRPGGSNPSGLSRTVAFKHSESQPPVCFEVLCRKMRTLTACDTKTLRGVVLLRFAIPVALFFATNLVGLAQSIPSGRTTASSQSAFSKQALGSEESSSASLMMPLKSQTLQAAYHPITPQQSLRWFITSTIGPPHLAGGVFVSACGTAVNRPPEYGPHWGGFADRFGMNMAGSATGNTIEAASALILREDPRYFRVPDRPFKARVGNVVRLTFAARSRTGRFGPAYGRYTAIFGSNFLSNSWRVHSEANPHDALLRTLEGFAGRMVANAFEEFWPDVKKRVFHKRY
jgi:hypothetical protein